MEAGKRSVELNPYDMGARGVLGICHFVIGEHRDAIELFSEAVQRGNSDPRYQWASMNAFSQSSRKKILRSRLICGIASKAPFR